MQIRRISAVELRLMDADEMLFRLHDMPFAIFEEAFKRQDDLLRRAESQPLDRRSRTLNEVDRLVTVIRAFYAAYDQYSAMMAA